MNTEMPSWQPPGRLSRASGLEAWGSQVGWVAWERGRVYLLLKTSMTKTLASSVGGSPSLSHTTVSL